MSAPRLRATARRSRLLRGACARGDRMAVRSAAWHAPPARLRLALGQAAQTHPRARSRIVSAVQTRWPTAAGQHGRPHSQQGAWRHRRRGESRSDLPRLPQAKDWPRIARARQRAVAVAASCIAGHRRVATRRAAARVAHARWTREGEADPRGGTERLCRSGWDRPFRGIFSRSTFQRGGGYKFPPCREA